MRSSFRPRPSFMFPVALAAGLALLGAGVEARPRTHPRAPSQSGAQPSFIGTSDDGQSMIRQQSGLPAGTPGSAAAAGGTGGTQARPDFIGGAEDGQSIRRRQPGHRGGNHPHRGR